MYSDNCSFEGKSLQTFLENNFPQIVETLESFILFNAKSGRKDEVKRKKRFRVIFVLQESEMKCSGDIRCNNDGCFEWEAVWHLGAAARSSIASVFASLLEREGWRCAAVCQLRIFNRFETTMKYKCEFEGGRSGWRRVSGEGGARVTSLS